MALLIDNMFSKACSKSVLFPPYTLKKTFSGDQIPDLDFFSTFLNEGASKKNWLMKNRK